MDEQIRRIAKEISNYQYEINNSGNIQVVVKNIRLLVDALDILSSFSSSDLSNAGVNFVEGSPACWKKKVIASRNQIVSQVPFRSNYIKSDTFQPITDTMASILDDFCSIKIEPPKASASEKLAQCAKAFPLLPDVVFVELEMDGDSFEVPYICYSAVEDCLLLGLWDEAKRIVDFCDSCSAFYSSPDEFYNLVEYINTYAATAIIAFEYIKKHPGILQKDMYKLLSGQTDHSCLQHFLRCSEQIYKEKSGSTYKLFVK